MKNKNIHKFGIETPLFHEGRRVFQTGSPETPEQMEARVGQERAIELIDMLRNARKVNGVSDVDVLGNDDASKFLDANPFKHALIEKMSKHDLTGVNPDSIDHKQSDGILIIKYTKAGVQEEIKLEGKSYIALMWGSIEPELEAVTNISHAVMTKLAEEKNPKFLAFVSLISKDPANFSGAPTYSTLLAETIEAARKAAGLAGGVAPRAQVGLDSQRQLEDMKDSTDQELANFISKGRLSSKLTVGYWAMSIQGRSNEIDPKKWSFTSEAGIAKLKADWQTLGVLNSESNPYFDKLFMVLKRSYDTSFLNKKGSGITPERKLVYSNPIDVNGNIDERLTAMTDPAFDQAVRYFKEIKDTGVQHDNQRANTLDLIHKQGQEPVTTILGNAIRDNAVVFRDALRNGDWTTAGAYVLGLWAMYKAYDGMEGKNKTNFSKLAFRGAALYAAHLFAKNAGYDVLKKLGISDVDEELKGTSLEALYDIIPEMKNVNSGIVSRMAMTNIGDLYSNYLKTNDSKKHRFVDPALFGLEFKDEPAFARLKPSDVYDKSNLKGVKAKYFKTGQQLYLLVEALESAYDNTLKPTAEMNYKAFGEVVLGHPVYSKSTIMDFTIALRNYRVNYRPNKNKVMGVGEAAKLKSRLDDVFGKKNIGYKVESYESKADVFPGFLMGFPVVYLRDEESKGFHVVPKSIYDESKGNFNVLGKRIAFIPFEGNADDAVRQAKLALTEKMKDRLAIFMKDKRKNGVNLSAVRWNDSVGRWTATLTYNRVRLIPDAQLKPVPVFITPNDTGKGLQINSGIDDEILVYIGNLDDREGVRNSLILSHLTRQTKNAHGGINLKPLRWFYMAGNLQVIDNNPDDNVFGLKIGESLGGRLVEIEFDPSHGGFYKLKNPGDEEALLKDHDFQMGLSEGMGEKRFDAVLESFKRSIDDTDEEYIVNLFSHIPGWFTGATMDRWFHGVKANHFRGTMVKNYAYALLESQKEAIMAGFRFHVGKATSFSEVLAAESAYIAPGVGKMYKARDSFDGMKRKMDPKGEKFSETTFQHDVMRDLMELGLTSENYKEWYRNFVNQVFARLGPDTKNNGIKAARLIRVFAHYTAVIDTKEIDGADTLFKVDPVTGPLLDKIIELDEKLKRKATLLEINTAVARPAAAGGPLSLAEVTTLRGILPKYIATSKYNRAAKYAAHVAGRILSKMNQFDVAPDPSFNAWEIDSYDNDYYKDAGDYEVVDTTPRLSMSTDSDYLTLDMWLSKATAQRNALGWQRSKVSLPRKKLYQPFMLVTADDKALFHELVKEMFDKPDKTMTQLEAQFQTALMEKVRRVKDRIKDKWNTVSVSDGFNQHVADNFKVGFSFDQKTKVYDSTTKTFVLKTPGMVGPSINEITWMTPPTNAAGKQLPGGFDATDLSLMVANLEARIGRIGKTVTGTDQQAMIDEMVNNYFEEKILKPGVRERYFVTTGAWSKVKGFFKDIWLTITG